LNGLTPTPCLFAQTNTFPTGTQTKKHPYKVAGRDNKGFLDPRFSMLDLAAAAPAAIGHQASGIKKAAPVDTGATHPT